MVFTVLTKLYFLSNTNRSHSEEEATTILQVMQQLKIEETGLEDEDEEETSSIQVKQLQVRTRDTKTVLETFDKGLTEQCNLMLHSSRITVPTDLVVVVHNKWGGLMEVYEGCKEFEHALTELTGTVTVPIRNKAEVRIVWEFKHVVEVPKRVLLWRQLPVKFMPLGRCRVKGEWWCLCSICYSSHPLTLV